jgi:hypothetical protein
MSIPALLRCAAIPATVTLLLGSALAASEPGPAPDPPAVATPDTVKPAAPPRALPNLSGSWRLDPKASDDPSRVPGGGQGQGQGQGQGKGQGQGQGGGPGGGGGRGPALDPNQGRVPGEGFDGSEDPANEKAQAAGRQAAREFSELEIFHDGDEFDLTDGMEISRMLRIGGQPTDVFTPHGVVKATAAWENDTLVVTERDAQGQVWRSHHFLISAGGSTLTVRQIRQQPGKKAGADALTLVYRRQEDPAKP